MKKSLISEEELISRHADDPAMMHLAKTPIADKDKSLVRSHPQLYAMGFNAGGRPDGLWVSRGSAWMGKAKELDNPKFPVCCYIYRVGLKKSANVLRISSEEEFAKFDAAFPSYWINLDYFEVDFVDYLTGQSVHSARKYKLDLGKLRKRAGDTLKDTLLNNKIIFNSAEDATSCCEFYKHTAVPVERFKYKDWASVAEKYHGVVFDTWDISQRGSMKYLWFQSLDVASGCVWDVSAIESITLAYHKIDTSTWEIAE